MKQFYQIILRRMYDNQDKSFDEIAREAYEVLYILYDYPERLQPKYYSGYSKRHCKKFSWDFDEFCETLKKNVNKEGKTVFENLGYRISMFSDMNEDESFAFSLQVGMKNVKFHNSFIMECPINLNLQHEMEASMFVELFQRLINVFHPFWGCISDNILTYKYAPPYLSKGKLCCAHWLNYWPKEIAQTVGEEKIAKIMEKYPTITYRNDIFSLRDTAIDAFNPDDVTYFENVQKDLFGTLPKEECGRNK